MNGRSLTTNTIKGAPLQIENIYDASFVEQLRYYKDCYMLYDGYHWEGLKNITDESESSRRITVNYCRRLLDKINSFLFGKGWKIEYYDSNQEQLHEKLKLVWDVWNNRQLISDQIGITGLVSGNAFILLTYDNIFVTKENGQLVKKNKPKEESSIKIKVLDPATVFPYWDTYDRNKLVQVDIAYTVYEKVRNNIGNEEIEEQIYQLKITADTIEELQDGNPLSPPRKNPLGFIPIIHIKNTNIPHTFYGLSELENIKDLNKNYNYALSNVSEIINYHSRPLLVGKGISVDYIDPTDTFIQIDKEGDLDYVELKSELTAANEHVNQLKLAMHEISGVPEASLGRMQPISNTSAVALYTQYMPLLEIMENKRIIYGDGLIRLNAMILRMMDKLGLISENLIKGMTHKYQTKIKFEDPLPKDISTTLQALSMKLNMGLESKRGALQELKIENPDEKLEEIRQSEQEDLEIKLKEEEEKLKMNSKYDTKNNTNISGESNKNVNSKGNIKKGVNTGNEPNNGLNKKYQGMR